MYSLGDGAKNAKASIFHIEGDPDHPVNRGALCPKGAGLVDFIHSESRLKFPEYRAPGSDKWQQISWDEAFDRIAKLMKEEPRRQLYRAKRRRHHRQPLVDDRGCCAPPPPVTKPAI
ncbi:formate dehydrogenase-O alpha subunit [Klebsiella pneumoniae]|uniref:Formate dehydrogenase-O alpha subunit n=1 Tax=Klebsiella pneumoniae TaxID=573 RepID=A0A447RTY3_KLEPN|nr:formate dehydrogenase-O alpha subunit [Klebsiella pneumoniae]